MQHLEAPINLEQQTIDDIYALPDGEQTELIGWKIHYIAPPSKLIKESVENYIKQ